MAQCSFAQSMARLDRAAGEDARHLPLVFDGPAPVGAGRGGGRRALGRLGDHVVGRLLAGEELLGVGGAQRRRPGVGEARCRRSRSRRRRPASTGRRRPRWRNRPPCAPASRRSRRCARAARGCGSRSGSRRLPAPSRTGRGKTDRSGSSACRWGRSPPPRRAAPAWWPDDRWPDRRAPGCRPRSPGCAPADRRSPPRSPPAADISSGSARNARAPTRGCGRRSSGSRPPP